VQQFIRDIEQWGGSAKVCGAGSVTGDTGGIVLVIAEEQPTEICRRYGYTVSTLRGDPLGTRMI
jgi:mevalonate kinase